MTKSTSAHKKEIIHCPICDKNLIKKYISQHIRKIHKNNDYCSIIKRGMTYYKFYMKNTITKDDDLFFCNICNKSIKKSSLYNHKRTILHNFFLNKNSLNAETKKVEEKDDSKIVASFKKTSIDFETKLHSSIEYSRLSGVLIPKNFIDNNGAESFLEFNTEKVKDIEIKNDNSPSFSSISDSDSDSGVFSQFRQFDESFGDFNIESLEIKNDVEKIINRIEKRKKKNIKLYYE